MTKHISSFNEVLLVDKYKPKHFYEIIGLDYNNKNILKYISKWKDSIIGKLDLEEMKPLVFNGPAGTGKTTLAKLICDILNFEYLVINTSSE
jgi:replication-associated recombination protein RarA